MSYLRYMSNLEIYFSENLYCNLPRVFKNTPGSLTSNSKYRMRFKYTKPIIWKGISYERTADILNETRNSSTFFEFYLSHVILYFTKHLTGLK